MKPVTTWEAIGMSNGGGPNGGGAEPKLGSIGDSRESSKV